MPFSAEDMIKELMNVKNSITEISTTVKHIQSQFEDIKDAIKGINALSSTVERLAISNDHIMKTEIGACQDGIKRMGARLEALEKKPGHRWEQVTGQIIGILVAGAVGFFMARFM